MREQNSAEKGEAQRRECLLLCRRSATEDETMSRQQEGREEDGLVLAAFKPNEQTPCQCTSEGTA